METNRGRRSSVRGSRRMGRGPGATAWLTVAAAVLAFIAFAEFAETRADPTPRSQATAPGHPERLGQSTYIIDCGRRAVQRPVQYTLNCADRRVVLTDLAWTEWGDARAHATGRYVTRNCAKPCGHARYLATPVTVTADGVHRKNSVAIYTSFRVTFAAAKPNAARPKSTSYDITPGGPSHAPRSATRRH